MCSSDLDHLQPSWWARFSLVGALFAAVLLALAPLAYRLGLAGVQGAVLLLPAMASVLAFLAFLFGLFGFVLWLRGGRPADRIHVLVGGALSFAVLLQMGGQFALAQSVPAIHDISTDTVDPPAFVARHVDHHAALLIVGNGRKRVLQLRPAFAALRAEDVTRQAARMHADQRACPVVAIPDDEHAVNRH